MSDSIPVPFDVKLMNVTATLVFALFSLVLGVVNSVQFQSRTAHSVPHQG